MLAEEAKHSSRSMQSSNSQNELSCEESFISDATTPDRHLDISSEDEELDSR